MKYFGGVTGDETEVSSEESVEFILLKPTKPFWLFSGLEAF